MAQDELIEISYTGWTLGKYLRNTGSPRLVQQLVAEAERASQEFFDSEGENSKLANFYDGLSVGLYQD